MLLHRQGQKTFPVWRQREALPCGLEAVHQALTAPTSSLGHQFGEGGEMLPTLLRTAPRRRILFYIVILSSTPLCLPSLLLFFLIFFFLITWLVLFFSCLIALALNPVEKLPWLIYTEHLFRPKAAAPFSQAPLCYPVSLLVIIRCFLLNPHCEEAVVKCMQQMTALSERGFLKLSVPRVIINKQFPSKRQLYPEMHNNHSWF